MRQLGLLLIGFAAVGTAASVKFVAGGPLPGSAPARLYGPNPPAYYQIAGSSCAASACHGNGEIGQAGGEHSTWAPEVFPAGPSDPHGLAYRVLFNADSARMAKLLKLPQPPHRAALCLKCHAVDGVAPAGAAAEGVGCGACHGPAEKWLALHHLPDWHGLTDRDKFERYGFVPTKNLTARIMACAKCHVGAADREVNHDLIAAGHPRLAFEYTRFHFHPLYRKHWVEQAPQPDFEVRAWAVGQAATLRAAVELLQARAGRAAADDPHTPWPEFSGYSCYSCHQTVGTGDLRRAVGRADRKPGSLAWELWSNGAVEVAADLTGEAFPGTSAGPMPELSALRKLMEQTNPNPAKVRDQADRALAELDRWLARLQTAEERDRGMQVAPGTARRIARAIATNALTADGERLRDHDWDFVSANYLGAAAMYHAEGGGATEPAWARPVNQLARLLRFPPPTGRGARRIDSPTGFGPTERERAAQLFRALRDATADPGADR